MGQIVTLHPDSTVVVTRPARPDIQDLDLQYSNTKNWLTIKINIENLDFGMRFGFDNRFLTLFDLSRTSNYKW